MSVALRSLKEHDRVDVAHHRYRRHNKGFDKQGRGQSGLGWWSARDYLARIGQLPEEGGKKGA